MAQPLTLESMTEVVGQKHGQAFYDAANAALARAANGKDIGPIEVGIVADTSGRSVVECSASIAGKEFVWADIIPAKEND